MKKLTISALMLALSMGVANAADHTVKMLNTGTAGMFVFEPSFLQVEKGDTVTFEATDSGHNAVSELSSGEAWEVGYDGGTVTFNKEGVNVYSCTPHKSLGMVGIIQVGAATNKEVAVETANAIESTLGMNQGRVSALAEKIK